MAKKYTHKPFQQIQRCIVLTKKLIRIYLFIFITAQASGQTITSFSPLSAVVGTSVTIAGSGFNTTATNNIVFFGATRATVTSASSTSLTVTVPSGATHAPITVLNTSTSLMAYSTAFFFPTFTPNKSFLTTSDIATKIDFGTGFMPYSIAIGDLNGDGKPDLVTANSANGPDVSVLRNTSTNGTVSFAPKVEYTTGGQPQAVVLCDIDGDGKLDIASANSGANNISVLHNTSTGGNITFATKVDFPAVSGVVGIASGDINGDGKPDLVALNRTGASSISVLRNTSTVGTINFATKVDFAVGANPQSVAVGDIDGDSKVDIVTANDGAGTISVLRNISTISLVNFATKVDFNADTNPYSVVLGDIDGDGKRDIAVANYGFTSGGNNISILRNTSNSGVISFASRVNFATGTNPTNVTIGDINGDGKLDLAVSNTNSNNVSLLPNTSTIGSFSFAGKIDVPTGTNPYAVGIVDVDGDNKSDISVTNSNASVNTVSIIRNTLKVPDIILFSNLTNFSACTGNVSVPQSFSIRGVNLVANISVTAPSGFEISTNQTSGYTSSITLARTADSVATTVLYVRM
ncbi:MAG: FG-GAP-like repeat-containing protein, partial [Bacteroidota bacterium]